MYVPVGDTYRSYRVDLDRAQLEALATVGACECFGIDRRAALWAAGASSEQRPGQLPGIVVGDTAPALPAFDEIELAAADHWAMGITPPRQLTRHSFFANSFPRRTSTRRVTFCSRRMAAGSKLQASSVTGNGLGLLGA